MNLRSTKLVAMLLLLLLMFVPVTAQTTDTRVTVTGEVQEILSPYAFVMERTDPFDFGDVDVVVINDDTQPFLTDVNVGKTVQVTGTIQSLSFDDILNTVDYEVEAALFEAYESSDYSVIASAVIDPVELPAAATFDYDPVFIAEFQLDPTSYLGDTFTVEGYVAEILGPYSFRLRETQPFDLSPASFLVINDDTEPFAVDINVGRYVRVTGPIYAFEPDTFNAVNYDYDGEVFVDYDDGDYSMIGESVVAISAPTSDTVYETDTDTILSSVTMDDLEDDPFAYLGETVTIRGEIEETYTDTDFLLEEDEFFDLDPMQIPVFGSVEIHDEDTFMDFIDDELYLVTGEVVAFNLVEIENMIGYAPDPDLYVDFDEDNIAIIATAINRVTNE